MGGGVISSLQSHQESGWSRLFWEDFGVWGSADLDVEPSGSLVPPNVWNKGQSD